MTGNRASNTTLRTLRLGLVPVTNEQDCCVMHCRGSSHQASMLIAASVECPAG